MLFCGSRTSLLEDGTEAFAMSAAMSAWRLSECGSGKRPPRRSTVMAADARATCFIAGLVAQWGAP